MPTIVLATRNAGKVREMKRILEGIGAEVLSLEDFPCVEPAEETGETFAENAAIKAVSVAKAAGLIAIADDSGLEVDALDGAPGVLSSRFAVGDEDRNRKLLGLLEDVPEIQRTARYRAVIAIASPDGEVHLADGICEGRIAFEPRGTGGFGYDPIFYLPEFGKTMAEIDPDTKNAISHRGKALAAARNVLSLL